MIHITDTASHTVVAEARDMLIQVNTGFTGTITVANTIQGTIAVITNPVAGNQFVYGGLAKQGAITVQASATCDITVTIDPREI